MSSSKLTIQIKLGPENSPDRLIHLLSKGGVILVSGCTKKSIVSVTVAIWLVLWLLV